MRALQVFAHADVGRLPVVDDDGQLVGIITPGDITSGVLRALEKAYEEEEIRRYRVKHVFEDISSDHTSFDPALRCRRARFPPGWPCLQPPQADAESSRH